MQELQHEGHNVTILRHLDIARRMEHCSNARVAATLQKNHGGCCRNAMGVMQGARRGDSHRKLKRSTGGNFDGSLI